MSKAPHHGRATSNLRLKSISHRQSRVQQPSRAQIADFRHQTKPESLTNWSLQGVPREQNAGGNHRTSVTHPSRLMDCSRRCSYADRETPGHVLAPKILARHVVKYWIIGLSFCMIS